MEKDKIILGLASYISSLDIDEFLCKKMKCKRGLYGDEGDIYDCYDCIIKFFSTECKWKADNDVCTNGDCKKYCADFVSAEHCGSCRYKEIEGKL